MRKYVLTIAALALIAVCALSGFAAAGNLTAFKTAARAEALELTAVTGDGSREGWSWNEKTQTLTLQNADITSIGAPCILLPEGVTTIKLVGDNKLTCKGPSSKSLYAISTDFNSGKLGDLVITGDGKLDISCENSGYNAGGITAENIKVDGKAEISIAVECRAPNKCARGIWAEYDFSSKGASYDIALSAYNADDESLGIFASRGDIAIEGGKVKIDADCPSSNAQGIASYEGDVSIDAPVEVDINAKYDSIGVHGGGEIALGKASAMDFEIESKQGSAWGVTTNGGSVAIEGDFLADVDALYDAGGVFAPINVTLNGSQFVVNAASSDAKAESIQDNGGYMAAYGLAGCRQVLINNSALNIITKTNACTAEGVLSLGDLAISNSKLTASTTAKTGEAYCLHIPASAVEGFEPGTLTINSTSMNLSGGASAILAYGKAAVSGIKITEGGKLRAVKLDGGKAYAVAAEKLAAKDGKLAGAATKVVIEAVEK